MTDVVLILLLIVLNGAFALSEMAVVSAPPAKLQTLAAEGHVGAAAASRLQSEPSVFLSTIHVGVTTIAILNGAIGGAALAQPLAVWPGSYPPLAPLKKRIAALQALRL